MLQKKLLVGFFVVTVTTLPLSTHAQKAERHAHQLFSLINRVRLRKYLPQWTKQMQLQTAAKMHAEDMRDRKYFTHESPEGNRVGDRVKLANYPDIDLENCECSFETHVGENLAKGQKSARQVVREWLHSRNHRGLLLSPVYTEAGIGKAGEVWVLVVGHTEIKK